MHYCASKARKYCRSIGAIALLTPCLILTHCGFTLGNIEVPKKLHTLSLKSTRPFSPFERKLRHTLNTAGITIKDNAPYTLNVLSTSLKQSSPDNGQSIQSREYKLSYKASFTLQDPQGNNIIPDQLVTTSEYMTVSSLQTLHSNAHFQIVKSNMQQAIAEQILYRLTANNLVKRLHSRL